MTRKSKDQLLDVEGQQEHRDMTLLLQLIEQGDRNARAGKTTPQRDVFRALRERLAEKKGSKPTGQATHRSPARAL